MSEQSDPSGTTPRQHIGVALSGGGHRASLFALGALLYLMDAGKGPELAAVTSVSGGSITNGYAGLGDLRTESGAAFRERLRPVAQACATRGTLFAGGLTYAFLAVVGVILVVGLVVAFVLGGWWAPVLVVVTLLVVGRLLMLRGWLPELTLDATLFHKRPLSDVRTGIDHVMCATDLQTAEQVHFSGGWIRSWRLGVGRPGISLARAVSSSAAFPGGFYPRRLAIKDLGFQHPDVIPSMLLSDGGVYDNMGTEWFLGGRPGDPPSRSADTLIVVNGSAPLGITPRPLLSIPIVGEFAEMMAVLMTSYDQTTAVRRRWLDDDFRNDELGRAGALIPIERSPAYLAESFAKYRDDKGKRARDVLALLDAEGRDAWAAAAKAAAAVGTNLSALGVDTAANLIRHAYVLTMANTHVLLGYPLLPIPGRAELEEWVR